MASRMHRDKGFQIKTYNPEHSCKNWYHHNKTITSSFIARRYLDTISSNRDLKVSKFRDTISRQLKAHISLPQARRAKRKAIALLDGDIKDQFAMLWDYINELERTNPGLLEAFNDGLSFEVGFSGFSLRNALWAAAKSTTENMILEAQDKPIITLLEKLRYILMARIQANRDKGEKWNLGDVWRRIKDILHKNEAAAAAFIPQKSNKWNYKILGKSMDDNWAVDLHNKTCSCRKWKITRYPCKHAISAIWAKNDEVINYVDDRYMVETYRKIYEYAILSINRSQLWPKSCKIPPLPPKNVKQKRGRKQKSRKKEFGEARASRTRMKRKQTTIECSICHKPDHNKRTCKFSYVETETDLNEPVFWQSTTSSYLEKLAVRRGELSEVRKGEVEHGSSHYY
ncbi:uncharacterized protein [Nicotiana sylvestris]|uniref:uncharacterized protein n=1 Tax=Nicotiana sylvestris TaxID=4096 RepID=UPI00388CCABF